MKKVLYIVITIIIISIMGIVSNKVDSNKFDLVIGAPISLTGSAAVDGINIKRGIDLAVSDLEEKGVKVKVICEDDGTDPKRTVSSVEKIMSLDKPDALIGPTWSFLAESASANIKKYSVLSYQPADTSEFVSGNNPYVFFGTVKNVQKQVPTENWLKEVNVKKVAIIVDKAPWGESHIEAFKNAIKNAGAEAVLIEEIPYGSEGAEIPVIIAKMKNLGVDGILTTGYDDGMTLIMKKTQELNFHVPVLMASAIPAELVENNVVGVYPEDQFYYMKTRISDEFSKKFHGKYGVEPSSYADSAYDGVMMISEAMTKKAKGETLADYFKNKINYKGYQTTYSFDQNGDIKGGEWVVERLK